MPVMKSSLPADSRPVGNRSLLSAHYLVAALSGLLLLFAMEPAKAQSTLSHSGLYQVNLQEAPVPEVRVSQSYDPYTGQTTDAAGSTLSTADDVRFQMASQSDWQSNTGLLQLNNELFRPMLDFQNRQSNKEILLLDSRIPEDGVIVSFGGQARLSMLASKTNTADKFNYMGRFPTDFSGTTATDARMLHANAALAVQLNPWTHVYGETLFSDVFSFADSKQGSFQVRQAYAVFGDLEQTPWYAYIGKKNVSFGDMGTLSPFSQSMVWHYFGALHEGVGIGYNNHGWDLSVAALNGGRGIRVADSEAKGKLNNLAANATWSRLTQDGSIVVGAGFLLGTIYDATVAEHLDPTAFGDYNSAWDVHAQWNWRNWTVAGEFVTTVDPWPATGEAVTAYRSELAYDLHNMIYPTRLSVSWSEGLQGDEGTEFEFNRQLVIGMGTRLSPNALVSLEYVRGSGFAPLIAITTVSDRSVTQDSVVAGIVLTF